ncbi:MAG: NAD-dependent epimerase/dehydratase family protein [Lentisphaerae bacterium]|nr:NAD-dependent epimerase/dehydratase family protein [Lentisphaerota bacterium]
MSNQTCMVTGSSGLIGSAVCEYFHDRGFAVNGLDNNQRAVFLGSEGDTRANQHRLEQSLPGFRHHELDIRDRQGVMDLIRQLRPAVIVHTAAQPSHDRAAAIPFDDFDTNAVGTLNLLEATRRFAAEAPFIHMSTNKVYGDRPNLIPLQEEETRWDYADPAYRHGIAEDFPIDQSTHSLFGSSKTAADILVQEYGRYFGMPCCCLRGSCLTGPWHAGVELHGFLSYLIKCNLEQREYHIQGYKGKQVRDNIHSSDVAAFIFGFYQNPRAGEVYNLGGGPANACSILEAFTMTEQITGRPMRHSYHDQHRIGDHICYYSNLSKTREHYPDWQVRISLRQIMEDLAQSWQTLLHRPKLV